MNTPIADLINLTGKVAIVTGSAMGIGQGIAARLHEAGANVVIADFNETVATATAAQFNSLRPNSAVAIKTDVSQSADITNLVAKTIETFGSIDILVNNAGIYPFQPLSAMTEDSFMKVINVNLRGAFLCVKFVSEQMIKQGHGGKIINITSIDALHPSMVGLAHYDASKHGLWGFTKNVALELAEHKIWINAIAPGGIATPGATPTDPAAIEAMKSVTTAFLAKIPMHRMGEADEIGKVALFLASELSSYMTGEQILVDGGALLI
jgi:2-dehydro-3-deoxy-D-gluconate 5-dehydrogenase